MTVTWKLPDLAQGSVSATVLEIFGRVKQPVAQDDPFMEIETNKAVVEVPCPVDGILVRLYVARDQEIVVGSNVASFLTSQDVLNIDSESQTAMHNLRLYDIEDECQKPFQAYRDKLFRVKSCAEQFKGLNLHQLDIQQRMELKQVLYKIWRPLAEMRKYRLGRSGDEIQKRKIADLFQTDFLDSTDTLEDLLKRALAASRPTVFIGSSTQSLPIAQQVQKELSHEIDCSLWKNDSAFELGKSTLDGLLQAADRYDFGIFVFGADDEATKNDKLVYLPRDNVVFEFGLFLGRLGRDRAFILCDKKSSILTDLKGIHLARFSVDNSLGDLHVALGSPCSKIADAIHAAWAHAQT